MPHSLRIALRALGRHKLRTALTTLGLTPPEIDVWDYARQDGHLAVTQAGS